MLDFKVQNREISERIVSLTKKHKVTFYRLEKDLGIRQSTLSGNKNKNASWGVESLMKIAGYFKVSLDWLILGKEYNETQQIENLKSQLEDKEKKLSEAHFEIQKLKRALLEFLNP